MTKQYTSSNAFRTALEERLKNISRERSIDIQRLRRQVAFDRFLCRLFTTYPGDLFLKGGYAMELRIKSSRTTKDIDLILKNPKKGHPQDSQQGLLQMLQDGLRIEGKDFFRFFIGNPTLDLEAPPYGGLRFPVEAHLDARLFVRFPIDVVISSLVLEPIESIPGQNWLEFAGIEALPFPMISKEQQFAEKLHAYTFPQLDRENSRVKDMVDMLLLTKMGEIKPDIMRTAIEKIFHYRNTHKIPTELQKPPGSWNSRFEKLAKECGLSENLESAFDAVHRFWASMILSERGM